MKYHKLFIVFSIFFAIAAIYHLFAVFFPLNSLPWWRDLLFVIIDTFVLYGVLKRPKYFVFLFAVFLLQQYYSHSSDFLTKWQTLHKIDWISLLVLIYLPVVFVFLILDYRKDN